MYSCTPRLRIDTSIIRANYSALKEIASTSSVAAVVKGNCYGLGVNAIAPVLQEVGCKDFFVANIEEGIELREVLGNQEIRILILNGVFQDTVVPMVDFDLIPVISDLQQLEIWSKHAKFVGQKLPLVLHFDTGMNRLGISPNELQNLGEIKELDLQLIMSHYASSDDELSEQNETQNRLFAELSGNWPNVPKSICNSAGTMHEHTQHYDMVRIGGALFGLITHPKISKYISNPVSLHVPIIQIRDIKSGQEVGYNGTFKAAKDMKIATVAIGYADGYFRELSSKGIMYINGAAAPVIGRVSMDLTIIDISNVAQEYCYIGSAVEIFGPNQTPSDLASILNTVPQEITTSLGNRLQRHYN